MTSLRILTSVLASRFGAGVFVCAFVFVCLAIFAFNERTFIADVLTGHFPISLFAAILPDLLTGFLFERGALPVHYFAVAALVALYVTLLLYVFVWKKYFSVGSFSISVFGLVGVSLGVSCLSCGAIAGIILASTFGAAASSAFLILDNHLFLFIGEAFLLISIILVLSAIKRLTI